MRTVLIFASLILLAACGSGESEESTDGLMKDSLSTNVVQLDQPQIITPEQDDEVKIYQQNGITLTEIKAEPSKAELVLNTKSFIEGNNKLNFQVVSVSDYNIAYLANNSYLTTFSSDVFEMEFLYGNNVFLAFLTDKNNIAIKSNRGSVLQNAVVGDMENLFDMNQPHLFYYLPQASTTHPILDFYLVNTSIAESGNKVKVTINQSEFIIDKWAAYQLSGLPSPQNTIRIQLVDKNGKLIDGPFNDSGERTFSIVNKAS